jgi:hypothetical protein
MTRMTAESDFHRYAGARPPDRRRTCPEIVASVAVIAAVVAVVPLAAVVAAGVANAVADSAVAPVAAVAAAAAAAAALLVSTRANIAVQRYILGDAACGNDIGTGRRQETHDFPSF